eukprot:12389710-Heterocapsa_arctica.AAC.1
MPSVIAWIHLPLSKCLVSPVGKICFSFLGCLTITPTPPIFCPEDGSHFWREKRVKTLLGCDTLGSPDLLPRES